LTWSIQQLELDERDGEEEIDLLMELGDILRGRTKRLRFPAQRKEDF
jgi:hypothetical protein